jgi:hypothetical protein
MRQSLNTKGERNINLRLGNRIINHGKSDCFGVYLKGCIFLKEI